MTWRGPNPDPDHPHPVWVHTRARVQHQVASTEWIETYTYTDGLGRVALTKALATGAPDATPGLLSATRRPFPHRQPLGGNRPDRLRQQRQPG